MNTVNKTTASVFLDTVISKQVQKATEPELVLAKLVARFDREAKLGATVTVPVMGRSVANDKVKGVPVSYQAPTETNISIAIDQYKESSHLIEDITELQSSNNLRALYAEEDAKAIARALDSYLASLASGFSNTKGTYNTAITTDVVLDAIELLDLADVPMSDRHFVFRSDVKRDLLDLAQYTSSDYVGGSPTSTGEIGKLYGVMTHQSNNLVKSGDNTNNMLFHKNAIALAVARNARTETGYDMDYKAYKMSTDVIFGAKELRDDFGVLVKS